MDTYLPQEAETLPLPSRPRRRLGWVIHLILLALYPLSIGIISAKYSDPSAGAAIPSDPWQLVLMTVEQLGLFFVIFALAWVASRATADDLMIRWRGGWHPWWRGLVYSVGLRFMILILAVIAVLFCVAVLRWDKDALQQLRPQIENVVDPKALAADPFLLVLNLTLVSFVLAGFREELWRAGMLAALATLFPRFYKTIWGKGAAVLLVAIVFGLGHLPQGWGGVVLTGVLGVGLGVIMVFHHSIWDAVLAHGFFNATSFMALYFIAPYFDKLINQ